MSALRNGKLRTKRGVEFLILKIMIIALTAAAFIMGIREGNCTAAILLLLLLFPAIVKNDEKGEMEK